MDEMAETSAPPDAQAATGDAPDDAQLVGRVLAGDESAFEELFNRHRRRVSLIASRFFRRREQIEEIIQESFTKAYLALPDFSNERETSFASWLPSSTTPATRSKIAEPPSKPSRKPKPAQHFC